MFSPIEQYLAALGDIESSGNYGALGPTTKSGDRAYGKYQVMGSNIPDWTEIATGTRMSPKDFLASPDAQDAVARKYFGGYVDQYGSPQAAASMWFSGKPNVNSSASDGYNTVPQYVSKFNNALSKYQNGAPPLMSAYADANNSPAPGQGDGLSAIAAALANPSAGIPPNVAALVQNKAPATAGGWPNTGPDVASDPLVPQSTPLGPAGTPGSPFAGPVAPGAAAPAAPAGSPPLPLWLQSGIQPGQSGGFPDAAPANSTPTQLAQADNGTASDATPPWAKMGLGGGLAGLGNSLQTAGGYLMGINDPKGGAAMVNAANEMALARLKMMTPEWKPLGTDIYGQTQYGLVNPLTGKVTPYNGNGTPGGTNGGMDSVSAALASGKTGEELLSQPGIPEAVKSIVRGISGGAQQYNEATLLRSGIGRAAAALLPQYEPGTTSADYVGRAAGMRDWATKSAEITRRAGQSVLHMGELPQSFEDLDNGSVPLLNWVKNTWNTQTGHGATTAADMNIVAAGNELAAFMRGSNISDASVQHWLDNIPLNGSKEQQAASVGKLSQLWKDAFQELEQKRLQAVGPLQAEKMKPLMTPQMQASLDKMDAFAAKYAPKRPGQAAAPSGDVVDYRTYFGQQ